MGHKFKSLTLATFVTLTGCDKGPLASKIDGEISGDFIVNNLSPAEVRQGEAITIEGKGLQDVDVFVDGQTVEILTRGANSISFKVPDVAPGIANVEVKLGEDESRHNFLLLSDETAKKSVTKDETQGQADGPRCADGELMQWSEESDGWICTGLDALGLIRQGSDTCADNEVLKWDGSLKEWTCGSDLISAGMAAGAANEYLKGNLTYADFQTDVSANADVMASKASRHDAVEIATANGLSLSGQQLSLGLASAGTTGALSSADWSAFNNKVDAAGGTMTGMLTLPAVKITGGTPGVGKVLTAIDASGNTDWVMPHAEVELGTANGLTLVGQQLSLGLASAGASGALSAGDWSTFNDKLDAAGGTMTGTLTVPAIKITGGSPGAGKVLTGLDGNGNADWAPPTGDVSYGSSASSPADKVFVNDSGFVGIGTLTPSTDLDVNGDIHAKKLCDETGANCVDLSNRFVGVKVSTVAATAANHTVFVPVIFDVEDFDTNGFHAAGSGSIVIPAGLAGYYDISCRASINSTTGTVIMKVMAGAVEILRTQVRAADINPTAVSNHTIKNLAVGDAITLHVWQNSGASVNLSGSGQECALRYLGN